MFVMIAGEEPGNKATMFVMIAGRSLGTRLPCL